MDVAFDCAGFDSTWEAALNATRTRGKIVVVALWSKPAAIDLFVRLTLLFVEDLC